MFVDKILNLYREAYVHGLPVSLSLSHLNGRESFSFTILGPDLAGQPEHCCHPHRGRRRRGHGYHGASAVHPANAGPSYAAVARSLLLPPVARTTKHVRWLNTAAAIEAANAEQTTSFDVATSVVPRAVVSSLVTLAADMRALATGEAADEAIHAAAQNLKRQFLAPAPFSPALPPSRTISSPTLVCECGFSYPLSTCKSN